MKDISESRDGVLGEALAKNNGELLKAWTKLDNDLGHVVSNNVKRGVRHLSTVKRGLDEGIELTFESIEEGAKVLNKNGNEVADAIKIVGNTGETLVNPRFIKLADGSLGFVEDVASFGSKAVQSTIKKRGALRKALKGIKATEDAHHIIPVQLLKQNSVVKKGATPKNSFNQQ